MKKLFLFIFAVCMTLFISVSAASANSSVRSWEPDGSRGSGVYLVTDNPIDVLKEDLIFNLGEEDCSVSAEYTFYNSSDTDIEAELLFPIGYVLDNNENFYSYNPKVYVNSSQISTTTRIAFKNKYFDKSVVDALATIHDEYIPTGPKYYDGTMPDYYECTIDTTSYSGNYVFNISLDDACFLDGSTSLTISGKNSFYFYSNYDTFNVTINDSNNNSVPYSVNSSSNITSKAIKEFLVSMYGEKACDSYNQVDLYNYYFYYYNYYPIAVIDYKISIPAKSSITNKVETELYYGYDDRYTPESGVIEYYVTPASTFQSFKDLNVTVNMNDIYLIDNNLGIEKVKESTTTYTMHFDELPTEDFRFTTNTNYSPEFDNGSAAWAIFGIIGIFAVVVVATMLIVFGSFALASLIVPLIIVIKKHLFHKNLLLFIENCLLLSIIVLIMCFNIVVATIDSRFLLIPAIAILTLRVVGAFTINKKYYTNKTLIFDITCIVLEVIIALLSVITGINSTQIILAICSIIYLFNISYYFFKEAFKKKEENIK